MRWATRRMTRLGLIRTNELLKADEYYSTRQLWGTEADFRLLEDAGRGLCAVGTRACAV